MKNFLKISLTSFITIILLLGFALPLNPVGNWYQQFLPTGLPNFQVSDMTFLDSLTGFIVTGNNSPNDSSGYILKTTNGGDNWVLKFAEYRDFSRVIFINNNTGFVSGGYFNGARLYKTTNSGDNWFSAVIPGGQIFINDMSILNLDTIWLAIDDAVTGGVFRTTNGGLNWQQQFTQFSSNPRRIYLFNARIGFIDRSLSTILMKTTNGGLNWFTIAGENGFDKMHFADSLTGWKARNGIIKKTTNTGLNWVTQTLPFGGGIVESSMYDFSVINKDTIWGVGGLYSFGSSNDRGMIYRTTNGGDNWLFQIPDTAIHIPRYLHVTFVSKKIGWAYFQTIGGVHTTNGGDTTFLMGIHQISINIPKEFKLFQNYPNPFNPKTNIKYQLLNTSHVKITVYDITGKHIVDLVNQKQTAGTYLVDFSGNGLSSGVYFYKLTVETGKEVFTETKKMILVK